MNRYVRSRSMLVAALVLLVAASIVGWKSRRYWFARNFREVEAGKIYAGGHQHPRQLNKILRQYRIKTVLSLLEEKAQQASPEEQIVVSQGVAFRHLPILAPWKLPPEQVRQMSAGERRQAIEAAALDAVAILADAQNQPIYVHCWAGCHRAGLVIALYRVKHCGWSYETAQAELVRWGGATEGETYPTRMLRDYCDRQQLAAQEAAPIH